MAELASERTCIFIFRHAQSAANAGKRTVDPKTVPITDTGFRQAQFIADLITTSPRVIVVSSYLRTVQTAEPLVSRYPRTPLEEWPIEEFTYLNPVACAGTTYAERGTIRDSYWSRCDPLHTDGRGCESFSDFVARVRRLESALARRSGRDITVVITHGLVIRALLWLQSRIPAHIGQAEMADFNIFRRKIGVPNCSYVRAIPQRDSLWVSATPAVSHLPEELRSE